MKVELKVEIIYNPDRLSCQEQIQVFYIIFGLLCYNLRGLVLSRLKESMA